MSDLINAEGADISIDFCGYHLKSPYILSSGPLSYSAEGMICAYNAGAGAVVTKTIRLNAADNPVHHMGTVGNNSLINCEKWSDIDWKTWCEKEIPEAVNAGVVVIASVGHTLEEAKAIVTEVWKAGAHMIELVSYTEDTLIPMLDYTKKHTDIPVICKLSGNWPDAVKTAGECLRHGADGLCAIDSIGPVLKIDIRTGEPEMKGDGGFGWLTGSAVKPIALRYNYEIAGKYPDLMNLYGSGGVMTAEDAIEYMMAGAGAVGICTAPILKGTGYIKTLCRELSLKLKGLGYNSAREVNRKAIRFFNSKETKGSIKFTFSPFEEDGKTRKCISCRKCENVCCYQARKLQFPEMTVDLQKCRFCGLCMDVCPKGAIGSE